MKKEIRTVCYDEALRIEAYHFEGIVQPFPNHFHEYYVIGFVEQGVRCLTCKSREYNIKQGDILLFNPGDNHACTQADDGTFDYRGINITKAEMLKLSEEALGRKVLPYFMDTVIDDDELAYYLRTLHQMMMSRSAEFEKEEHLIFMMTLLIERYSCPIKRDERKYYEEVEDACLYIQEHYSEHIGLVELCQCAGLSKSALLRAFTKSKGVTPYRYLQAVRVNEAKKLLEKGIAPIEAAMMTGFSDQSHFTRFFTMFIGLSPGSYKRICTNQSEEGKKGEFNDEY